MSLIRIIIILFCLLPCNLHSQDTEGWFPFRPTEFKPGNSIDMSGWLDKPAGKHGFLQYSDKDFQFENGTPVKFWGVNIASHKPFSPPEESKKWTAFLAHHGINAVRFHKFTWDATDGIQSTRITDENWKNFDRFCHNLREAGIYYSWSHIYGHRVRPADSSRLLAYAEIANTRFPWAHLNQTTASIVNFAEDLQELNIELTVNMLNHVNPITGLRYADDPALSFIELQNEDNIFWGAIEETLKQTPTYRALLCRKFSLWLKKKYGSEENLRKSWNNLGLAAGESLQQENIYPRPGHGYFSYESEQAIKHNRPLPRHVADQAQFLYEEQLAFYTKFIGAIRATGYKGVIVSSCWQAGSGIAHFYNLHTDYIAGPVDRHNYFGGGTGHRLVAGKIVNEAMVSKPGSGLLSTGFQQVADRPFQLSEWMSLVPTEWIAESAPIIASYGMGLQGWDASYSFAMDYSSYTPTIQSGHGVYNVTSPTHLSLYPALSAMIYRNDIRESPVVVNRNININDLKAGVLKINEKITQQTDFKNFTSTVPIESLAAGRVTLSFDQAGADSVTGLHKYINEKDKEVKSATGQLTWNYAGKGYFSINTEATKAVVGFTGGKTFRLENITLKPLTTFSVIYVTSMARNQDLNTSDRILITTVARARNTGMKYNAEKTELLEVGKAPVLLEPVVCELQMNRKGNPVVYALDHSGNRTGVRVPVVNGKILLDGRKYKTLYYEMVW